MALCGSRRWCNPGLSRRGVFLAVLRVGACTLLLSLRGPLGPRGEATLQAGSSVCTLAGVGAVMEHRLELLLVQHLQLLHLLHVLLLQAGELRASRRGGRLEASEPRRLAGVTCRQRLAGPRPPIVIRLGATVVPP